MLSSDCEELNTSQISLQSHSNFMLLAFSLRMGAMLFIRPNKESYLSISCLYFCIYTYTYIYLFICTHTHMYIFSNYLFTHPFICLFIYLSIHLYLPIHLSISEYKYIFVYVCVLCVVVIGLISLYIYAAVRCCYTSTGRFDFTLTCVISLVPGVGYRHRAT